MLPIRPVGHHQSRPHFCYSFLRIINRIQCLAHCIARICSHSFSWRVWPISSLSPLGVSIPRDISLDGMLRSIRMVLLLRLNTQKPFSLENANCIFRCYKFQVLRCVQLPLTSVWFTWYPLALVVHCSCCQGRMVQRFSLSTVSSRHFVVVWHLPVLVMLHAFVVIRGHSFRRGAAIQSGFH